MNKRTTITILLILFAVLVFDRIVNNYLLFHVIAEFFAICILFTLFIITWNAKEFLTNGYLMFIGIGGIFIGILDLMHTLTYTGMNIIESPVFYANQFWIATRLFESLMILTGLIFVSGKHLIKRNYLMIIYSIITTAIILSILVFENFPVCYIENVGQTNFKIYGEFVVIGILITSLFILIREESFFEKDVHNLLISSVIFAILSESCFTLYAQNYDYINKLGHVFKILSFFMILKANVQSGFTKPMETFFRDLKISDEKIKESYRELEKQITTKNRFFSILAHDLRSPFTVLLGYSEHLIENFNSLKEEDKTRMLNYIHETSNDTFKLLENLLYWSMTQSNNLKYNPSEFDLKELLDECLNLTSKQAQLKNIEIKGLYSNDLVKADKEMIKTVLRNLLTNAVKFTPKGGLITIKTIRTDNKVEISISDTGVGIPKDKMDMLFSIDKNQSTRGTENEKGIGLGLIICNEFIRLHKSELKIKSELNKGSVFSFSLPVCLDA